MVQAEVPRSDEEQTAAEEYDPDIKLVEDPKPVPESAIKSVGISHDAAKSLDKLRDLEQMGRELGVASGQDRPSAALDRARSEIHQTASDRDKVALLVKTVISEQLMAAATHTVNNEKQKNQYAADSEGRIRADLIQPIRIAYNDTSKYLGPEARANHPELAKLANTLNQEKHDEMKATAAEGVNQFYEQMTGVTLEKRRFAFQEANQALVDLKAKGDAKDQSYEQGAQIREKHYQLERQLRDLEKIKEVSTSEKHITLPLALNDREEFAGYYYDGAPDGTMSASDWLQEVEAITREARDFKPEVKEEPKEEPKQEEASTEEGKPAEKVGFWGRLFGGGK
jgi:hypothetical protein